MELDQIALKNSVWVWDNLREARFHGFQVGEESITDFIVLNIKKWGAGKIIVDTFTRHKESVNGSDWEWWFTGPSGMWLGMRLQAKVLNLASEKYEHLHHKNKNGQQVDLLVNDARKNGLIPIYCMYTNWDPKKYKAGWKCTIYKRSVRQYGTAILNPSIVKKLQIKNETSLSSIIHNLKPMHCLFCCCSMSSIVDLPHRAISWLHGSGLLEVDAIQENESGSFLREKPPHYVHKLLEGGLKDDFIDVDDERLRRVTVFREIADEKK